MGLFLDNAWLVPALPFFSFLLVGLLISPFFRRWAAVVATASVASSALLALMIARDYFLRYPPGTDHPALVVWPFEWLRFHDHLAVHAGVLLDPPSILLMVVVTVVSTLVHLYSIGYMADDPGAGRYFTFLNLFTFSMLGLVVSPNIVQTFVFWELVGVSSFLLIGFYYRRSSAVAASKKAFIVTRFADLFFFIGILLLGYQGYHLLDSGVVSVTSAQAFDFSFLNGAPAISALAGQGVLTLACVLIFVGAAGKSAMFPLHIWLPDAMEGPTPVSALIHAATMVVAGIFLVARLFPLFAASTVALSVVAYVGAFTCLFGAVIACTQFDIKRVLAYSTLSQLGYMMLSLGVASGTHTLGYTASLFHLLTHAMFKALLFLGAGAIIHAVHSNDIREMGGLWRRMPVTHITFLVAVLASAGIPPLSGFFSKDMILAAALENHRLDIFAVGIVVAGLTAFYMGRIYLVAFRGTHQSDLSSRAHEAPVVMLIPLMILALFSVITGFVPVDEYIGIGSTHSGHGSFFVPILATAAGIAGLVVAWRTYGSSRAVLSVAPGERGRFYGWAYQGFAIDSVYLFVTKRLIFPYVSAPIAWFDRHVVDATMHLIGRWTRDGGVLMSRLQTGQAQTYTLWLTNGVVIIAIILWWFNR